MFIIIIIIITIIINTLTGHFIRYTCSKCLVTQIANQPITWQQLNAFRHLDLLKFEPSIRMGKKGDLSDFEHGMVVGARRLVWVFQLLIYWDTTISRVYREWSEKRENIQ